MAIQRYKIALNNALFPLVSTKAQRVVFVNQLEVKDNYINFGK